MHMRGHAQSALGERVGCGLLVYTVLIVACTAGLPALAATVMDQASSAGDSATQAAPAAASAQGVRVDPQLPHRTARRPPTSRLEARVQLLTTQLGLNAKQQTGVRRVLISQREQVMRIWNDASVPPDYRVGATRAITERTAGQIRALLTEEQQAKFLRGGAARGPQPEAANAGVGDRADATSPR